MKVTNEKEKEKQIPKSHLKTTSQDFNNSSNSSNIYVSKLINQSKNKIKSENLINDNLPNLKICIRNIFSNEDKKEKVFRYLIQKNKERSANTSKDLMHALQTPEIKSFQKIELQTRRIISPYNNKNYYSSKPIISTYDFNKSSAIIRQTDIREKNGNNMNNRGYRYSVATQYIYEDEPFGSNNIYKGNGNCFWQNNNNTFTNLLTNNNSINVNRNRGNKFEHISIYNTYNNTFNNYRMQKNKVYKNLANQTYDFGKGYSLFGFKNKLANKNNNPLEENPFKDYMKNSNLSYIKRKFLEKINKNVFIDISDNENNNQNNVDINPKDDNQNMANKKNNYIKSDKNERIKVQKNENLNVKRLLNKNNDNLINNKSNTNFYIHKNFGYKKLNQAKNAKNALGYIKNEKNDNVNKKTYEKRKNYYDLYGQKDIHLNTFSQNNKENENRRDKDKKINTIKINIDKNILRDYNNSPLSNRYNKYFIDNKNKPPNNRFNKKTYEKRETIQKSSELNYNNIENNNNNNNNNRLVFNDEEEIIEYIKKKYNKRNIDEIITRGRNNNKVIVGMGMMTSEEGKKMRQKNDQLSTEIKNLKYENRQHKKELNDMKNRFNDLSKEINTIKGNK